MTYLDIRTNMSDERGSDSLFALNHVRGYAIAEAHQVHRKALYLLTILVLAITITSMVQSFFTLDTPIYQIDGSIQCVSGFQVEDR